MRHWSETESCHNMRHLVWNRNKDPVTRDTWSETEARTQQRQKPGLKQKQRWSDMRHLVWSRKKKMQWCETETKAPVVKQKQRHLVWSKNKDAVMRDTWSETETKTQWRETPGLKKKQRCSDVRQRTRCYSLRSVTEVFISEVINNYYLSFQRHCLDTFSPGGFTACTASAAFKKKSLALLHKNHSRCVWNSLSPPLHKAATKICIHYWK